MIAVCGDHEPLLGGKQQVLLGHEAMDFLVVDLHAFLLQELGHAPIACADRLPSDPVEVLTQGRICLLNGSHRRCRLLMPIVGGARDPGQTTFAGKGEGLGSDLDLLDHRSPRFPSLSGRLGGNAGLAVSSVC